ncbi:hypothetical protein B14911_16145 [Bacillus sp. NRRL B-14911]|nr:hypothetical protein B14911_16145 [Bacillus sp. NRRL B-14911]
MASKDFMIGSFNTNAPIPKRTPVNDRNIGNTRLLKVNSIVKNPPQFPIRKNSIFEIRLMATHKSDSLVNSAIVHLHLLSAFRNQIGQKKSPVGPILN